MHACSTSNCWNICWCCSIFTLLDSGPWTVLVKIGLEGWIYKSKVTNSVKDKNSRSMVMSRRNWKPFKEMLSLEFWRVDVTELSSPLAVDNLKAVQVQLQCHSNSLDPWNGCMSSKAADDSPHHCRRRRDHKCYQGWSFWETQMQPLIENWDSWGENNQFTFCLYLAFSALCYK